MQALDDSRNKTKGADMLWRDRRTLLVFTLVALISSILAVSTPMASAEVGDPNSISGTVTRPSTAPVRGILVTGTLDGGGDSFTVVTDIAGVYSAVGLTAGGWTIKFEDLDNKTLATEWYSVAGGAGLESGADPVTVTDGVATVGIDTQLALGAAVNGTITDTTGAPVPALMSLYTSAGGTLVDTQTADADGSYRFRGLQAGSYFVNAEDPVFGVDEWLGLGAFPGTEVVVVEGQLDGGNGITLTGGRIIGSVNSGGVPLGGIPISFDGGGTVPTVFSGSDGTYASPFLASDTYTIDFGSFAGDAGNVVGTALFDNGATDIGAVPTISGTVTSGGLPLAGVDVAITNGGYSTMTETAPDGTYMAYAPAAAGGTYTVDFTTPNYGDVLGVTAGSPEAGVDAVMVANPAVSGPPAGTSIQTNGIAVNGLPRISGLAGPRLTHEGCPGGFAEVVLDDGASTWSQQMDETDTGIYFVKIPQVSDIGLGGTTLITITVTCPDLSVDIIAFSVYIDPAGRVFDTLDIPVFSATVTLYRDDPSTGVVDFAIVPERVCGHGSVDQLGQPPDHGCFRFFPMGPRARHLQGRRGERRVLLAG